MNHIALLAVLLAGGGAALRLAWHRVASLFRRTPDRRTPDRRAPDRRTPETDDD